MQLDDFSKALTVFRSPKERKIFQYPSWSRGDGSSKGVAIAKITAIPLHVTAPDPSPSWNQRKITDSHYRRAS